MKNREKSYLFVAFGNVLFVFSVGIALGFTIGVGVGVSSGVATVVGMFPEIIGTLSACPAM